MVCHLVIDDVLPVGAFTIIELERVWNKRFHAGYAVLVFHALATGRMTSWITPKNTDILAGGEVASSVGTFLFVCAGYSGGTPRIWLAAGVGNAGKAREEEKMKIKERKSEDTEKKM